MLEVLKHCLHQVHDIFLRGISGHFDLHALLCDHQGLETPHALVVPANALELLELHSQ